MTRLIWGSHSSPFVRTNELAVIIRCAKFVDCYNIVLQVHEMERLSICSTVFTRIHATGNGGCLISKPSENAVVKIDRTCMLDIHGDRYLLLYCLRTLPYDFTATYVSGTITSDSANSVLVAAGDDVTFSHGNLSNIRMPNSHGTHCMCTTTDHTCTSDYITITNCQAYRFLVVAGDTNYLGHHLFQKCNLLHNIEGKSGSLLVATYRGSTTLRECVFVGNDFTTTVGREGGTISVFECTFDKMILNNVNPASGNENGHTGEIVAHAVLDFTVCFLEAAQTIQKRQLRLVRAVFLWICLLL